MVTTKIRFLLVNIDLNFEHLFNENNLNFDCSQSWDVHLNGRPS
jgi:hypothetical protein